MFFNQFINGISIFIVLMSFQIHLFHDINGNYFLLHLKQYFRYEIFSLIFLMKFLKKLNKTPLHIAVENNNFEIVKLLLSRKDIDANSKMI